MNGPALQLLPERKDSKNRMEYHLRLPLNNEDIRKLRVGDFVYLSGPMLTARDAAHKRLCEAVLREEALPVPLEGETVYYMGPTPAPPGRVIGAAGPTTAGRMDAYAPTLLDLGLKVMIAKGKRNDAVKNAIVRNGGLYLAAIGGAGALLSKCIKSAEVLAYADLGTEAIRRLMVEEFPAIVAIDSEGNDIYRY